MTLGSTLINWRRELHQYPELSLQEDATTARIHAWLHAADVNILPFELKTGLVAENRSRRRCYCAAGGYRRATDRRKRRRSVSLPHAGRDACLRARCSHQRYAWRRAAA